MYNNFLPLVCKIEDGLIGNVADIILGKFDNVKKVLIASDEFIFKTYGYIVYDSIKNNGVEVNKIMINDSTFEMAQIIGEELLSGDYDSLIGIGGGKIQDTCKFASFMSKKNFFSIPTTLANDGLCSPIAVLKMKDGFTKSIGTKLPLALFIDTNIVANSPIELRKAGIGDILSNYTAIYDWRVAEKCNKDTINDFALSISDISFNVINNISKTDIEISDKNFIEQLAEAIVLSGIAMYIAGTSRPCSGSEHLFSHTIDRLYNKKNLHGLQVALGSIVAAYLQGRDYGKLINLLKRFDIDVRPEILNLTQNEYIDCWKHAKESRKERYTILNEIDEDTLEKKIEEIYEIIEEEFNK